MKALLLLISIAYSVDSVNYSNLRNLYSEAANDKYKAKLLMSECETYMSDNYIAKGYYGATKMLMAKYYFNPYSKLKTFSEGKSIIESAIASNPSSTELRYLRFTIQTNSPSYLGYKSEINSDKQFLISSLSSMYDMELKEIINSYLKNYAKQNK